MFYTVRSNAGIWDVINHTLKPHNFVHKHECKSIAQHNAYKKKWGNPVVKLVTLFGRNSVNPSTRGRMSSSRSAPTKLIAQSSRIGTSKWLEVIPIATSYSNNHTFALICKTFSITCSVASILHARVAMTRQKLANILSILTNCDSLISYPLSASSLTQWTRM